MVTGGARMRRSKRPLNPAIIAGLTPDRGMSHPRLLVTITLLVAAAFSVWALLPVIFVEESGEPAVTSVVTEPLASISENDELPASEPEPERMPTTSRDTQDRHTEFFAAAEAFDLNAPVDVPQTVSVEAKAPVLVFDMRLSADLSEYLPYSTVRAADVAVGDGGPRLLWFGNDSDPSKGLALNTTSVFAETEWLGVFLVGPAGECHWQPAESLWVVDDAFGSHPLLVDRGAGRWESILVAPFIGVKQERLIDWRNVPARGDQFDRLWKKQLHLEGAPARDGIVFRYEGGHRYLPRPQGGRGNSAHHWNLLAYAIEYIPAESIMTLESEPCIGQLMQGAFPEDWVVQFGDRFSLQSLKAVPAGAN